MIVMSKLFDSRLAWAYRPASMRKVGGFLFTLALLGAPAFAQLGGSGAGNDEAAPAGGSDDDAEVSGLSDDEKREKAEAMLQDNRAALARGSTVLAEARAAKDVVQLNCVNEKLTQIKGLLKISEEGSAHMYEGIASGLADVVNHEFTKLSVAHQKVAVLRAELDQCVGESSVYTGETEVDVVVDEEGQQTDPTKTPPAEPAPEMPAVSSTF